MRSSLNCFVGLHRKHDGIVRVRHPVARWVFEGANIAWSRPKSLRLQPKAEKMLDQ